MPVLAANVVSTTQPLAAQAGLRMLLAGGNAVDAALAAAITLTVVEPVMNGLGGDAFALIWDQGKLHGLNASGRAPQAWTPEHFAGLEAMPQMGWDTVTVPGQIAGWAELSQRFGKLPFATLFEPAIAYAAEGFAVTPIIARQWASQAPLLKDQPGFASTFFPDNSTPKAGQVWRCAAQARTLERIASSLGRDFYEGELADKIAAFAASTGGALTAADLASHRCEWVEPLSMPYRGEYTLHEIPPNGQGIAALMALGMLDSFEPPRPDQPLDLFHLPIEAVKLAFADLHEYVGEPANMGKLTEQLLDRSYLNERAKLIDPAIARTPSAGMPSQGGTVYLTAADSSGMMVSFIQSNYQGFGSGVVVPETGIAMHNRGRGFSLKPGHRNQVGPGKRPMHTIIPAFITRQGQPFASFGVMGGNMQAQGHVQMMQQLIDLGRNPQAAVDALRFRVEAGPRVMLEAHAPADLAAALQAYGHKVELQSPNSLDFGAAQLILRQDNGIYIGASDPRRDGQAVGF
ncbi:gamma-glutamyltransferase family protein [Pusillimonas harenae]|uniref:Gamma-glutamyltransferase family protein n=2 Tax=Pollutimonas harenae TaxID=657015 RepID=A0A853GTX7_9BURK|nr:gamma-glutamyltransferase family protein [Pollutimonas harenae]NYT85607.1 gamma-glutamyltransferase family protein [Pollutimonas harenae]TEA71510.1 gamma-glutamyltransferase family protein [Pollutimonas harenae]